MDAHGKGRAFERLCRWYLLSAPEYDLDAIWPWDEWPGRWGPDSGISLVARTSDGEIWAVQCKAYADGYTIRKADRRLLPCRGLTSRDRIPAADRDHRLDRPAGAVDAAPPGTPDRPDPALAAATFAAAHTAFDPTDTLSGETAPLAPLRGPRRPSASANRFERPLTRSAHPRCPPEAARPRSSASSTHGGRRRGAWRRRVCSSPRRRGPAHRLRGRQAASVEPNLERA
jgi:hypothetical protein